MFDDNIFLNDPRSTVEMATTFLQPAIFASLPASDQLFLWRRARAVVIWNQRAALLKAMDNGLQGTQRSDAERDIALINNWFARQHYNSNIEAATSHTVTPLLDAARLQSLVEQSNQAAQDIATTGVAVDLVRIGTDLANAARGNVGGPVHPAADGRRRAAATLGSRLWEGDEPGPGKSMINFALAAAAGIVAVIVLTVLARAQEDGDD